jgi:hypothetical protein
MIKWIDILWRKVRKLCPHLWATTHTNIYSIPTIQVCEICRVKREMVGHPHNDKEVNKFFVFWWKYSNGKWKRDERVFKHIIKLDPPINQP